MSTILIVAEHRRGELRAVSLEMVTAAQALRRAADDRVVLAIVGAHADRFVKSCSVMGVDEVITATTATPEFDGDTFREVVSALIVERKPAVVLVPHSVDSMGYAAALATEGQYGYATDVFKMEYIGADLVATRGGYGQKVCVEMEFPGRETVVLAVRASSFKAPGDPASPQITAVQIPVSGVRIKNLDFMTLSSADDIDMTAEEFILSVGRGVSEEDNIERFRELADLVGAKLGCSRPIADSGWLPKSRQIGQSGKTAAQCKLYIAMGISGAIQHLAGMKHVETVIAVNTDSNASIFSVAKYGIVGDMFEIADELEKQFS